MNARRLTLVHGVPEPQSPVFDRAIQPRKQRVGRGGGEFPSAVR
jgi:hypothetical protein